MFECMKGVYIKYIKMCCQLGRKCQISVHNNKLLHCKQLLRPYKLIYQAMGLYSYNLKHCGIVCSYCLKAKQLEVIVTLNIKKYNVKSLE